MKINSSMAISTKVFIELFVLHNESVIFLSNKGLDAVNPIKRYSQLLQNVAGQDSF